ncbi:MAG TPA: hypothetical protein VD788_14875 [Candidatus Polarisedimenticolaceae bacterium]|nr:hypothetical protein [Candidatus Polarisedimenticolaceae bacterium]
MNSKRILGTWIVAVAATVIPAQAQIFVDTQNGSCTDAGSGLPAAPFCTIQAAYDFAADGAEIRVLPGTYTECLFLFDLDTQKSIEVVANAWLTSTDNSVTIIDGSTVPSVDCEFATSLAPASVVNIGGTASRFTGFTVTGGTASGIFGVGSVEITDNVVTGNTSTIGGGIYVYSGNCYYGDTVMTISDNQVTGNSVTLQGGGMSIAAGLSVNAQNPDPITCPFDGDATITINNNTIDGNTSESNGGGIYATVFTNDQRQATVTITSNTISDNTSSTPGQSGTIGYGAGLYGLTYGYGTERIEVEDNTITGNSTLDFGGGAQLTVFPTVIASSIDHQYHVSDNQISGNRAGRGGGGMELFVSVLDMNNPQAFSMIAENNTLTNNVAGVVGTTTIDDLDESFGGGGLLLTMESLSSDSPNMEFSVRNNTITGNSAKLLGGGVSMFVEADALPPGAVSVAPADAFLDFRNNRVTGNSTDSNVRNAVGGGVFALLTARGQDAVADVDATWNTISSNTLDNQAEPGGFHLESLTSADPLSATDGQAALTLDSSIVSGNNGVGFGGPSPGTAGVKTVGGTAEFSVVTTYNDLFGHPQGNLSGWVVSGTGNITTDPLLDASFLPGLCSPTIDAANPALPFAPEPAPNGGRANMGFTGGTAAAQRSLADVSGDGEVDGIDVGRLAVAFGAQTGVHVRYNAAVDLDQNGMVDGVDLAVIAADFQRVCP